MFFKTDLTITDSFLKPQNLTGFEIEYQELRMFLFIQVSGL